MHVCVRYAYQQLTEYSSSCLKIDAPPPPPSLFIYIASENILSPIKFPPSFSYAYTSLALSLHSVLRIIEFFHIDFLSLSLSSLLSNLPPPLSPLFSV